MIYFRDARLRASRQAAEVRALLSHERRTRHYRRAELLTTTAHRDWVEDSRDIAFEICACWAATPRYLMRGMRACKKGAAMTIFDAAT